MKRSQWIFLAAAGFLTAWIVSRFQISPGYMDADYYFAGGLRLAEGHGFTELILWNFLDNPVGLPHPSHVYWMPLPSILAALGMIVQRSFDFSAARAGFLLVSLMIAPVTAALALKITKNRGVGMIAGVLAVLPGYYLAYVPSTESFGICLLLGGIFFYLLPNGLSLDENSRNKASLRALGLGFMSGCIHLCRVEGFVWLLAALAAVSLGGRASSRDNRIRRVLLPAAFCLLGYSLVMGPWLLRNLLTFGALLNPSGDRALWIREYNELFIYPASQIGFQNWSLSGWEAILDARLWAAGQNLQTAAAVQGEIFLLPFIIAGIWQLRKDFRIRIAISIWAALFFLMTVLFPFQGARGGFFHAGAAVQPVLWAVAPIGFYTILGWGARKRGWNLAQAKTVFTGGLIGLALLLTVFVNVNRLSASQDQRGSWNASYLRYSEVAEKLRELPDGSTAAVMVNNAPGFFVASHQPSISIPYTDLEGICSAAHRYRVDFLLLEMDQILGDEDLFDHPMDRNCLRYFGTAADVRIFGIK